MSEGYLRMKIDRALKKDKNPTLCRVIAATARKGGIGKTVTTVSLAAVFADMGYRVLVIDLDDSGDATAYLGGDNIDWNYTIADVFEGNATISEAITPTDITNDSDGCLSFIGSDLRNQVYASQYSADNEKKLYLRNEISKLRDRFDFILIDSPPTMGFFNLSTIFASDYIITPIDPGPQDLRSFTSLIQTINEAKAINTKLIHLGCFITKPVKVSRMYKEVTSLLESYGSLFKTEIPHDIKIKEAFAEGVPITKYSSKSHGARAYIQLAEEVIEKCQQVENQRAAL